MNDFLFEVRRVCFITLYGLSARNVSQIILNCIIVFLMQLFYLNKFLFYFILFYEQSSNPTQPVNNNWVGSIWV
jgi:hypothetical protein